MKAMTSMETTGGEITLHDLLAWEPRLAVASPPPSATTPDPLSREVDWVVTARATAPMLPTVRGGELIILPHRIVQKTGIPFSRLIREITHHPIAGILTEEPAPEIPEASIAVLTLPRMEPETEGELNRLLATRRRELISIAGRIDEVFRESASHGQRMADLIGSLADLVSAPISIVADDDTLLLSTERTITTGMERRAPAWISTPLGGNRTLWLGPTSPEHRARSRVVIDRIRNGLQRRTGSETSAGVLGDTRTWALRTLLLPEAPEIPEPLAHVASQAGIVPGRELRVALAPAATGSRRLRRILAPLGEIQEAGMVDGLTAVVTIAPAPGARSPAPVTGSSTEWVAISGPAESVRELAGAARQARYVARLRERGLLGGPVVRFDDDAALGVFRILYPHWGTASLARYHDALLGDLRREDRRGTLLETLRIFLEEGGSLRPTADRLGIHRNTLAYRLRRIRPLIGVDLNSWHVRLGLQIALAAASLPDAPA